MANPIQKSIQDVKTLYTETVQEVKRCSWPTRQELMESTVLVIVTVLLLTVFVALVDAVSQHVVQRLIFS